MTLLITLSKRGDIGAIEHFSTPGLASQRAHELSNQGIISKIVPDELKEEVEYLYEQIRSKQEEGFVPEYGVVPNGRRSKAGARTIGKMIYPAFGGILEGSKPPYMAPAAEGHQKPEPDKGMSTPLTFSSKKTKPVSKKMDDDLIILRRG